MESFETLLTQHSATIRLINGTLKSNFPDLDSQSASVARNLLASTKPVLFGNETTQALQQNKNLTPNDPNADAMSLRYDDPLEDIDEISGQITILNKAIAIAEAAIQNTENAELKDHLFGRIAEFQGVIARMKEFIQSGGQIESRTPEQNSRFQALAFINRIRLAYAQGKAITGFNKHQTTYEDPSIITYRAEDPEWQVEQQQRTEREKKYSIDVTSSEFQSAITAAQTNRKYEDHEQIYLFVADGNEERGQIPYEMRVRKISIPEQPEQYVLTIKHGQGESRAEFESNITLEMYKAFKANQASGSNILNKRRFIIEKTDNHTLTVDALRLEDGTIDYSAEIELTNEGSFDTFSSPDWLSTQRTDKAFNMRNIAFKGMPRIETENEALNAVITQYCELVNRGCLTSRDIAEISEDTARILGKSSNIFGYNINMAALLTIHPQHLTEEQQQALIVGIPKLYQAFEELGSPNLVKRIRKHRIDGQFEMYSPTVGIRFRELSLDSRSFLTPIELKNHSVEEMKEIIQTVLNKSTEPQASI